VKGHPAISSRFNPSHAPLPFSTHIVLSDSFAIPILLWQQMHDAHGHSQVGRPGNAAIFVLSDVLTLGSRPVVV